MCQSINSWQYYFYNEFSLLFISTRSWTKILINFIIELFSNHYNDDIYDAILIIIDCFLKMTHYIFVKSTWSIENLIDVLFNKMLLIFFEIKEIIFDRKTLFMNDYWSTLSQNKSRIHFNHFNYLFNCCFRSIYTSAFI